MNEVCEFIKRRFPKDSNWLNGNCFYFAVILKARFPEGDIVYDQVNGHFLLKINNTYYDWTGIAKPYKTGVVSWNELDSYDHLLYERIIRDCIK
jgi:hypothetical protein